MTKDWINPYRGMVEANPNPGIKEEIWEKIEARSTFLVVWNKMQTYDGGDWPTLAFELGTLAEMINDDSIGLDINEEIKKLPPEFRAGYQDQKPIDSLDGSFFEIDPANINGAKEVVKSVIDKLSEE